MEVRVNKWMVALTVMLPTLMVIIDTAVVNVSLNHIRGSLSAGIDEATWSITSYLAANAIIIPMTGWLSRFFGRKRLLIFSVTFFTISSFLCGSAWSIQSLVVFRILQGLSGGSLQPISQSILLETFPPKQHGMAMALFGIGIMFGPIVGPVLGGWITDNLSWHWIFFINIPIGVVSVIMSMLFIHDPSYMQRTRMRIDYWGLILLSLGVGGLQMMLDRGERLDWFASQEMLAMAIISGAALLALVIVESFADQPIVNIRVFKDYSFGLGNLALFFFSVNLFGGLVLLPIYLQTLMGYTATLSGFALAPGGLANLLIMPIVGRLLSHYHPKALIIPGILVLAYSTYLMSCFTLGVDFTTVMWPRVVMGIGMALTFIPLTTLTLSDIEKEKLPNATSIFNLVRNLGGSFGVAITSTLLNRRTQFHQARLVEKLSPFDPIYAFQAQQGANALASGGIDPTQAGQGSLGVIYSHLLRQASMLGFNDVFFLLTIMIALLLPLILLMRQHHSLKSGS